MENWKPIEGWPDYEVSDLGRVRSLPREVAGCAGSTRRIQGRILASPSRKGYLRVRLPDRRDRFIHVLVLETFMGPRPPGQETRHLNGDKTDNRLINLAWGTHEENVADIIRHGGRSQERCRRGHLYSPDNTYIYDQGRKRRCRQCDLDRHKRHAEEKEWALCLSPQSSTAS